MMPWSKPMNMFFLMSHRRDKIYALTRMKQTCCAFFLIWVLVGLGLENAALAENITKHVQTGVLPTGETTELWTGALYSSTYRAGLCISADGRIRGGLFLRLANGQIDEYHFRGNVKNNHVEAYHSSGHSFVGQLVSHDKVTGQISLKNGMRFSLTGQRKQNVALNYSDCSPLP